VVKAAAVDSDGRWSAVVAGAWIFPDQVVHQQRPEGWPEVIEDVAADQSPLRIQFPYRMAPFVRSDNKSRSDLTYAALQAAPVVALVVDPPALMNDRDGLYSRSSRSAGRLLENVGVQVNADGRTVAYAARLSLSGSSSRYHDVTLKHSLRLHFAQSRSGGDGLPGTGAQLLLRNPTQDSWTVGGKWSGLRSSARYFADGMADQWLADRGHRHLARRWVHVFLNQMYWGLYEAVEQPGPESTGGTLLEGTAAAGTTPIYGTADAWRKLMTDAQSLALKSAAGHDTGAAWQELLTRLDAAGLADYIALNLWLGNKDWPNRNYLISSEDHRFHFLSWDAEYVMPVSVPSAPPQLVEILDASDGPAALFDLLCEAPAFRQVLRQRLGEEAGFHDAAFVALLDSVSARVRPLLPAEAARWGSFYNPGVDHAALWEQNVTWIAQSWIPGRAKEVRQVLLEYLDQIELNQAAAAVRLANQKDLPPPSAEPVAFIAALPAGEADRDGDGLPDAWELAQGLNPDDPSDASADPDGDGLDNLAEYRRRLDPHRKDAPAKPAPGFRTGAYNRMEQPVIRRGRIVDQAKATELKLSPAPATPAKDTATSDPSPDGGRTP
jgi:hypothetical protein